MNKPHITETEWKVMQVLWTKSPLYAREIADHLVAMKWTFATIKTLINRLVKKQAIGYEKEGKTYKYYPQVDEKDCIQDESKRFIDRIFRGSKKEFIASFVRETRLTDDEIAELRSLLDKKERK